jgi:hypothetical protein
MSHYFRLFQDVQRVAWSPKEDLLASASYNNSVRMYREGVKTDGRKVGWAQIFSPTLEHGQLNTWKRRLRAFLGNTFLLIF